MYFDIGLYDFRPSPEEIKRDALAGKGGLCYTINVFMKWLLEALGYDVYCVCGKVGDGVGHLAIIVNNVVKRGDRFIFDAGMGYPTFELTPLDFETETEIYSHSFLKYKFMWEGELVVRCHQRKAKSSDPLDLPGNMDNDWKKVMHIDLTPRELGFFDDLVNVIYTDVECKITPLNNSLRIVGYNEHTFKPVILKDAALLIEGDSSSLKEVKVNSSEEMLKIIEEHYPSLKSDGILALMRLDLFC